MPPVNCGFMRNIGIETFPWPIVTLFFSRMTQKRQKWRLVSELRTTNCPSSGSLDPPLRLKRPRRIFCTATTREHSGSVGTTSTSRWAKGRWSTNRSSWTSRTRTEIRSTLFNCTASEAAPPFGKSTKTAVRLHPHAAGYRPTRPTI